MSIANMNLLVEGREKKEKFNEMMMMMNNGVHGEGVCCTGV